MQTIDRDWGNIVLGVRVEDTAYKAVGSRLVGTDFVPLNVISESNERYDLAPLIGHNVSLFLDMNNLTDETDVRYTGKSWNPNQVEAYGRRYLVGVRYSR